MKDNREGSSSEKTSWKESDVDKPNLWIKVVRTSGLFSDKASSVKYNFFKREEGHGEKYRGGQIVEQLLEIQCWSLRGQQMP